MKLYDKNDYELKLEVIKTETPWYELDLNKEITSSDNKEKILKKKIAIISNLLK